MSVDMNSQSSDSNDDYNGDSEEDQGDMRDYYDGVAGDVEQQGADAFDPEEYQFTCLSYKESENVLNQQVDLMADTLKVRLWNCYAIVHDIRWVRKRKEKAIGLSPLQS